MWSVPAPWWTKLPSVAPLKGVSNFLYVWTHWETISEEQRKRDERLQAIEELAHQMVRLKEQVHEEEKRALERELEQEREAFRHVASFADQIALAIQEIEQNRKLIAGMRGLLDELTMWLAIILYVLRDDDVRDHVLASVSEPVREALKSALDSIAETPDAGAPTALNGGTKGRSLKPMGA